MTLDEAAREAVRTNDAKRAGRIVTEKGIVLDKTWERPQDVGPGEQRLTYLQWIVDNHQFLTFTDDSAPDGVDYDPSTANLCVKIANRLNPENREKFLALPWLRMGRVAWRMTG